MLRACLAGTGIGLGSVITVQSATSVGNVFEALGYLVLSYFAGWFLRGLRWPNLQPEESSDFQKMYQRVRLQHPESGFRIVKLRAEARLLEASRTGMWIVGGLALAAWVFRGTQLVAGDSIPHSIWALRVGLPVLVGFVFLSRERGVWAAYRGNVETLHELIFGERLPRQNDAVLEAAAEQSDATDAASPRR